MNKKLLIEDMKELFHGKMPLEIRWLLLKSLIMCQISPEVWHQCEIDYCAWKAKQIGNEIGWK
jgi:hypothetical protein